MLTFLSGFAAMTAALALIGITRARSLSSRPWTAVWTSVSLGYAAILVAVFVLDNAVASEVVQGASVGFAACVGIHTLHHFREMGKPDDPSTERGG